MMPERALGRTKAVLRLFQHDRHFFEDHDCQQVKDRTTLNGSSEYEVSVFSVASFGGLFRNGGAGGFR